ncbi:MAG: hypothetical protein AAGA56_18815 [Myxococcota bacterium]
MRRFTVEEYRRLARVGVLTQADRVELAGKRLIASVTDLLPA